MNIFMTSGTPAFMASLRNKYAKEMMIAMHGKGNSLLLHETARKTVFQTARRYEVIASSGILEEEGYFVFNNIPVTEEGRPVFEHRFKKLANAFNAEPGFIAFRLLRPLKSDTFIIMTEWSADTYYTMWKNSSSFKDAHFTDLSEVGVDNIQHIFTSASYVTTYTAKVKLEEDED